MLINGIKKKTAALVLLISCLAAGLPAFAEGNEAAGVTAPRLFTAEEVRKSAETPPEDYVENGPNPYGAPFDADVMAMVENEFLISRNGYNPETRANVLETEAYDSFDDYTTGNRKDLIYAPDTSYGHWNFAVSTAFDPTHTGQKRFAAYRYDENGAMILRVTDLVTNKTLEHWFEPDAIATDGYEYREMTYLYDLTAADFGSGYEDTLVMTVQNKTRSAPTHYSESILFYTLENGKLVSLRELAIRDYIENLAGYDYESYSVKASDRPSYAVKCGDFDRDGADEVALISTPVGKHAALRGRSSASIEDYTTEVAIIDDPLGSAERVYHETVYTPAPSGQQSLTALYAARGAVGDMDGNVAEELVLAGYVGNVTPKASGEFTNAFVPRADKIGLTMIAYNGSTYDRTAIRVTDMSTFIKGGFYTDDPAWNPLGVETAAISGQNAPAVLFVSGTLYAFDGSDFQKIYTYQRFEKAHDDFSTNTYVPVVLKGNFAHDGIGCEGFIFGIFYKTSGKKQMSVRLGYIAPTEARDGLHYEDNTPTVDRAFLVNRSDALYAAADALTFTAPDYDGDGLKCRYVGTEYFYSDPEVKAVLEAAPYFGELGDWADFVGATTYEITTGYAVSESGSSGFSMEAGYAFSEEAGFVAEVSSQLNIGLSGASRDTWADTYSTSYTTSFIAGPEDTVIIRRIPVEVYAYQVWDNEKGDWAKNDDGGLYYATTMFRLKPVFYQLSIGEYNLFAADYNETVGADPDAKALRLIRTAEEEEDSLFVLPYDSTGHPANYLGHKSDAALIGDAVYSLGYSGGFTTSAMSYSEDHSEGESWETGIHINYTIQVGFSFEFFNAGGSFKAGGYVDYQYSWSGETDEIKSSGYGASGMVANINRQNYLDEDFDYCRRYGFDWSFAEWQAELEEGHDPIPVYGYLLSDVRYPGQPPEAIEASLDEDYSLVTVTWEAPTNPVGFGGKVVGYAIYRRASDQSARELVGEVDADTYAFSEDYQNLRRGKNYTYYVGAIYSAGEVYTAISFEGSDIVGGLRDEKPDPQNDPGGKDIGNGKDKPADKETEKKPENGKGKKEAVPATGDESRTALFAVSALAAGIMTAYFARKKKTRAK